MIYWKSMIDEFRIILKQSIVLQVESRQGPTNKIEKWGSLSASNLGNHQQPISMQIKHFRYQGIFQLKRK